MNATFQLIKTDRLLLRHIVPDDIENIFQGLSHPEVIKYYGVNFSTLEETKEQMKWYESLEKNKTGFWWAICSHDNKSFYGAAGLNDINHTHRKAEVVMWLLPDHWGKGILSEAMPLVLKYGFDQLGLHRIEGFVESSNEKCIKAIKKIGFQYEGTMMDCEIKKGNYISLDIFAKFDGG